jgi:hypothetical protein
MEVQCFANPNHKEGVGLNKTILLALCLGGVLLAPNPGLAEWSNIGGFSNFSLEGVNPVILFAGSIPVARFDVLDCSVPPSSKIQLIKSDVFDGDKITIDGSRCTMMEIKPLGP